MGIVSVYETLYGSKKKNNTLLNKDTGTSETPEVQIADPETSKKLNDYRTVFNEMQGKEIENAMKAQGKQIKYTPEDQKLKYLEGLPDDAYEAMNDLAKRGRSFDSARHVIEEIYGSDAQSIKQIKVGGAKESDTILGKIQRSGFMKFFDNVNLMGKAGEAQNELVNQGLEYVDEKVREATGTDKGSNMWREARNKDIYERMQALSEDEVKKLFDKYEAETPLGYARRQQYPTFNAYVQASVTNIPEQMLGLGPVSSQMKNPLGQELVKSLNNAGVELPDWLSGTLEGGFTQGLKLDQAITKAPESLARTLSANAYALTNWWDNAMDIAWLVTTPNEGWKAIEEEYGSFDKFKEALTNDPFGVISDIMDVKALVKRAQAKSNQIKNIRNNIDLKNKKNAVLELAFQYESLLQKDKTPEGQTNLETVEKKGELEKAIEERDKAQEKVDKTNEKIKKDTELSREADRLSDIWDKEAIDNAVIKGLSKFGPVGKGIAYWYSLTQDTGRTIWNGVSYTEEKTQEGPNTQTLDELEGKQPNTQTLEELDQKIEDSKPTKVTVETPIVGGIKDKGAVKKVNSVLDNLKNIWEERTTGMSPELKQRIQENPYVSEYWNKLKAIVEDEGLSMSEQKVEEQFIEDIGNELLRRIGIIEDQVQEVGQGYNQIRSLDGTFNMTPTAEGIYEAFERAGITILPSGQLQFRTWSEAMTTDRNHAQILWNLMRYFINGNSMSASDYLDLRAQLKAIENYKKGMDPQSAGKSAMLARQLRYAINKVGHKEIPGLKELDAEYSKDAEYLRDLKRDITYQGGERSGTVRHNFFSIIRNMGTANRKKYAEIVGKIFPDLQLRVEATRMLPKIMKAYTKNSGLLSSVMNLPKYITAGQLARGDSFVKAGVSFLINQFIQEGILKPVDGNLRQATIDHLINSLTPDGQLKLEIALSDSMLGEETVVDKQVLDEVAKEIVAYTEAYREKLPKLPEPEADIIDEEGNVKLGRGNPITPQPQKKNDIVEINLFKPENKSELVQQIQEEQGVSEQTAEKIVKEIDLFQELMGVTEKGTVDYKNVDYSVFKDSTLTALYYNKNTPKTEKEKIMEVLNDRLKSKTLNESKEFWSEMDHYRAVEIDKLQEQEQRIGKVGKNKVGKEYKNKQKAEWSSKKEWIMEGILQTYGYNTVQEADDKFTELENKPRSYIDGYKNSEQYISETAEAEIVNKLLKGWEDTPQFVKDMDSKQITARNELHDKGLKNGYTFESTNYNDRYVLKEDGRVLDYGAIKYGKDGTITVIPQTINGFVESGLLDTLPSDAEIILAGGTEKQTIADLRGDKFQETGEGKEISREEGINQQNVINGMSVGELAEKYGIAITGMDKINVGKFRKARGKYSNGLITLADTILESTAPHELFHAVFDMVSERRKEQFIKEIMMNEGKSRAQAEETLADEFSKYFRTGEFDRQIVPKTFKQKLIYFFKEVAKVIFGLKEGGDKLETLFNDIIEGRIKRNNNYDGNTKYQTKNLTDEEKSKLVKDAGYLIGEVTNGMGYRSRYNSSSEFFDKAFKTYDPDPQKWFNNFEREADSEGWGTTVASNAEEFSYALIDLYYTMKVLQQDEKFMAGVKLADEDYPAVLRFKEFYDKIKRLPLNHQRTGTIYQDKIRKWLAFKYPELDLQQLFYAYNKNPFNRADNLKRREGVRVSYGDMIELLDILDKIEGEMPLSNRDPKNGPLYYSNVPIGNEWLEELMRAHVENLSEEGLIIERTEKIARNLSEDILEPALNDMGLSFKTQEEKDDVMLEITGIIGSTYEENIEKWHKKVNDGINKLINEKDLMVTGGEKKWNRISQQRLHQIRAKLREMIALAESDTYYELRSWAEDWDTDFGPGLSERQNSRINRLVHEAYVNWIENNEEVDVAKQLVALSNIKTPEFEKVIKKYGGKNPMPSIAVTDVNVPHTHFGDLTMVFGKETVDPEADPRNTIYGSDAATVTFPSDVIEEEGGSINKETAKEIVDKALNKIKEDYPKAERGSLEVDPEFIQHIVKTRSSDYPELVGEEEMDELHALALTKANELYDEVWDQTGKDMDTQEFMFWHETFLKALEDNKPREVIPASYLGGELHISRNQTDEAFRYTIIKELVDMVTPEQSQKWKDDGGVDENWTTEDGKRFSEPWYDEIHYEMNNALESIEDRPNNEPDQAGSNLLDKLTDDFGFDREKIRPLIEEIFGNLDAEERFEYDTVNTTDVAEQIVEWIDEAGSSLMVEGIRDGKYSIEDYGITEEEFMSGNEWHTGAVGIICDIIYNHAKGYLDDNYKFQWDKNQYDKVFKDIKNEIEKFIPEKNDLDLDSLIKKAIGEEPSGGPKPQPATPENIVRVMKQTKPYRTASEYSLLDLAKMLNTKIGIEEVRAKNLFDTTYGEWTEDFSMLEDRYRHIVRDIREEHFKSIENLKVRKMIKNALKEMEPKTNQNRLGKVNIGMFDEFKDALIKQDPTWKEVAYDYIWELLNTISMAQEVPTRFSESKPERVIDLYKEVKYILAPYDKLKEVNEIVKGTPLEGKVEGYEGGDRKPIERSKTIKRLQRKYGNIFFSLGGAVMPIAMLRLMASKIGGGGDDDQQEA